MRVATEDQPSSTACPTGYLFMPAVRCTLVDPSFKVVLPSREPRMLFCNISDGPHCRRTTESTSMPDLQPKQIIAPSPIWPPAPSPSATSSLVPHFSGLCQGPATIGWKTAILTIVERFLMMAHFVALSKLLSAKETAQLLLNYVFSLHGIPVDVVSDKGPQFSSVFW